MNKTFTTAKGIAHYPYISAPDTKFDEQGHYKVNLCLSKDDASPVLDIIKQEVLEGIKALKKDKPNLDIKQAPLPFSDEVDEEGNPIPVEKGIIEKGLNIISPLPKTSGSLKVTVP